MYMVYYKPDTSVIQWTLKVIFAYNNDRRKYYLVIIDQQLNNNKNNII